MENFYEINGKNYRLHYSIGRVELMEKSADMSVMTMFAKSSNGELPSISLLKTYFAYGLLDENGVYAPIKNAIEYAEKQLQENGYNFVLQAVLEQLQEDCGFLFPKG